MNANAQTAMRNGRWGWRNPQGWHVSYGGQLLEVTGCQRVMRAGALVGIMLEVRHFNHEAHDPIPAHAARVLERTYEEKAS